MEKVRMSNKPTHKKATPEKRGRGQPAFEPTDEQRNLVKLLAGFGIPQERICLVVNSPRTGRPITKETLERAFAHGLEVGSIEMDSVCASMLATKVRQGNMTAIIWYMKNRMGWRDVVEQQGGVPQRVVEIRREDLARQLEERGLPPSVFGVDVPVLELEPETRQPETAGQDG
jgi:hypothetical protein